MRETKSDASRPPESTSYTPAHAPDPTQPAHPATSSRIRLALAAALPPAVLSKVERATSPRIRLALAWVACLSVGLAVFYHGWTFLDRPHRPHGNSGHLNIDFASQWLMGRMILEGEGRRLYDRRAIRPVLERAYPPADEDPAQEMSDVDQVMVCLVQGDDKIAPETLGGSLYPPVHALLFAPFSLLPPHPAYRLMQVLNLLLPLVLGWVAQRLSNGRVWCPVAALVLFLMPGYSGAIALGQNAQFSLLVLALGWWQMMRRRPILAGTLWGLLAFKAVWAVAFFPVTLLTGRWRMALAMAATGLTLVALTLPLVGVQTWLDWLAVCRVATAGYESSGAWILFSRDLQGLVRRLFIMEPTRDWLMTAPNGALPNALALGLWGAVAAATVIVALWRRQAVRADAGPGAAFILLGGWLSAFHFMYYDTLLTALPLLLLFVRPEGKKLVPHVALVGLIASHWVLRPTTPFSGCYLPIDTYMLLGLWAWCGTQVIGTWKRRPPRVDRQPAV